jgi:myosin-5
MNILNEPEILANLKHRYAINKIYTKIGPTLIALNPYKAIDTLYNKEVNISTHRF